MGDCVCHQTDGRSLSLPISIKIRLLLGEDTEAFLMLRETCQRSLTPQLGKLTNDLLREEKKAGPEVKRFAAESDLLSGKEYDPQLTNAAMFACFFFFVVNQHRLAILCFPSGFPNSLDVEAHICSTDIRTLCWHAHKSTGKNVPLGAEIRPTFWPFNLDYSQIFTTNWIIARTEK